MIYLGSPWRKTENLSCAIHIEIFVGLTCAKIKPTDLLVQFLLLGPSRRVSQVCEEGTVGKTEEAQATHNHWEPQVLHKAPTQNWTFNWLSILFIEDVIVQN